MDELLKKIYKKVIVSCQAEKGNPLCERDCLLAMVKSVINGGAAGLRLAEPEIIKETKKVSNLPVIGITKPETLPENRIDTVYITPAYDDARIISEAGADIIALDGTNRKRPVETLEELIQKIKKNLQKVVMADISTIEEGLMCAEFGADIIATTLSGYTKYTKDKNNGGPDFELLSDLKSKLDMPVILEGRIWTPEQVRYAFELGAHAVVIGSAITRPEVITRRFVDY